MAGNVGVISAGGMGSINVRERGDVLQENVGVTPWLKQGDEDGGWRPRLPWGDVAELWDRGEDGQLPPNSEWVVVVGCVVDGPGER
jgi:hypothetical protein